MSTGLAPTTASIVESIKFTRYPGTCEHGKQHDRYEISWTNADRSRESNHVYWCRHPLCEGSDSPWTSIARPHVKLTCWIPHVPTAVAVAYLMVLTGVRNQRVVTEMHARIGVCDQWEDRQAGNIGNPDERRLFTERYFAESGPGVYPATITEQP